jgi:transcriptional antiterminator RfaH
MMVTWCVVYTQALKEAIAAQNLLEQGFEVYLPRFKKLRRHARKVEEVLAPLFPRYVFVGMDRDVAQWRSINGTRGVSHLLMTDDRHPASVPTAVIESLKAQEISAGVVPVETLAAFVKGEKVRILEGAFKDHVAIFDGLDDKSRVQILLTFLGRDTHISLPSYAVEVA